MKDTFLIYTELNEAIQGMSNEVAGELFKVIMLYNSTGEIPDMSPMVQMAFSLIKPQFDRNTQKWEESKKRREGSARNAANSRWGRQREVCETHKNDANTCETHKDNASECEAHKNDAADADNVPVHVPVPVSAKADKESMGNTDALPAHTRKTIPPTVQEVRAYCLERRNGIDAEHFCNYYAARGWELSRGRKMKDWQAAVRTWEHHGHGRDAPGIRANPFLDMLREEGLYDTGGDDQNAGDSAPGIPAGTGG